MPDIKFSCPHCLQHIQCDETWFGRIINCPSCRKDFLAPEAPASAPGRGPGVVASSRPDALSPLGTPLPRPPAAPPMPPAAGLAKASLLLSLASLLIGPLGFIPGIICGHMAKRRMHRSGSIQSKGTATAGLVVGYTFALLGFIVVGGLLMLGGWTGLRPESAAKREPSPSSDRGNGKRNDLVAWTMDPEKREIPLSPAAGMIRGTSFHPELFLIDRGVLKLRQGREFFADLEVSIFLFLKEGASISGQTFDIQPDDGGVAKPHVWIHAKPAGQSFPEQQAFVKGYALRLEFGPATTNSVAGKIYLALPDAQKSFVAGTFTAAIK